MTTLLFSLAIVVMTVALILMSKYIKNLQEEIDDLKDMFEIHREVHKFDSLLYSDTKMDHEQRLDKLEAALDLKEFFDEEPEPNTDNQ